MDTLKFCNLPEEELKSVLKERMNEHRYQHSLNVAKRAVFLAEKYGANPEKAEFVGLVHDICKGIPNEEQLSIIKSAGIELDEDTMKSPALWHSIAGAVYCEHELGVTDKDVLNAVRYHTSGRGKMSILEKVIYMADLTSAERNYPDAEYTRNLTDYSLDEGIAYGVRWIAGDLERRGFPKGKDTEALLEEYKNVKITF
ncbi:MAG: bis(5'-nucleosyl)-tetraphosphatase (symmetrical) YqeK [Oscillospiraceae bacterium]|nr:bis(5'-nucleosyl)-tetraphosphatase (symmetrical) YqeK [Oscillospiraceae bacterium]